jgi:hypothetical protein
MSKGTNRLTTGGLLGLIVVAGLGIDLLYSVEMHHPGNAICDLAIAGTGAALIATRKKQPPTPS